MAGHCRTDENPSCLRVKDISHEQTITGTLLPDAPPEDAVQTCSSCNKRRRFWNFAFLGAWMRCEHCATNYCSDCFRYLPKPDEARFGGRYCGECKAVILPPIPIDMRHWP